MEEFKKFSNLNVLLLSNPNQEPDLEKDNQFDVVLTTRKIISYPQARC
jgi:hypothetical protein